jgi:hypothetical protein
MPKGAILFCVLLGVAAVAQQTVSPRQRPTAPLIVFDPEQHVRGDDERGTPAADHVDRWNDRSSCQIRGIAGYLHVHGIDSGCGDDRWPETSVYQPAPPVAFIGRSPQINPTHKATREVLMHFVGTNVTSR